MKIIDTIPNLACAFTNATGGVSQDAFKSLNLKYPVTPQDEVGGEKNVYANRVKVCQSIGLDADKMVACQQVHSHHVYEVRSNDAGRGAQNTEAGIPETDGLLTQEVGIPLLIMVADCYPVMLVDPVKHVVAVVHSGWRGTQQQISVQAIKQMQSHGSHTSDIYCVIGTGIGFDSFEVGPEVVDAFREQIDLTQSKYVKAVGNKYRLNLPNILTQQITQTGVPIAQIQILGGDTLTDNNSFSYRRQNGMTGRQGVIVGWKA